MITSDFLVSETPWLNVLLFMTLNIYVSMSSLVREFPQFSHPIETEQSNEEF